MTDWSALGLGVMVRVSSSFEYDIFFGKKAKIFER